MTLKGHVGKKDDIGGATGMLIAADSLAGSEGAGKVGVKAEMMAMKQKGGVAITCAQRVRWGVRSGRGCWRLENHSIWKC
jgi:hypothetical protein